MNVVVISKDNPRAIAPMAQALADQNLLQNTVFVFDRCSKQDKAFFKQLSELYGFEYILNDKGEGRQTSYCRNLGFRWVSDNLFEEGTLFLDDDRWPVVGDLNILDKTDADVVLLKNQVDTREPILDMEPYNGLVYNNFFSNGLYLKKCASEKLLDFYRTNSHTYGKSIIFPENVQQYWGIEDTHLGDICYHLGLNITINNDIRLHGGFDKFDIDSIDTVELRLRLRDKLNVKW